MKILQLVDAEWTRENDLQTKLTQDMSYYTNSSKWDLFYICDST